MADKKENEMNAGIPAMIRALDKIGNSISVPILDVSKVISKSIIISAGALDDIKEAGEYVVHPNTPNSPFQSWAWLKIIGVNDIIQIIISFNTLEERKRSFINNRWSDWK